MRNNYLFTSESVTEGHPDKIADQISDSILDAILAQDPIARVACETLVTTGLAFVAGEIHPSEFFTVTGYVPIATAAKLPVGLIQNPSLCGGMPFSLMIAIA